MLYSKQSFLPTNVNIYALTNFRWIFGCSFREHSDDNAQPFQSLPCEDNYRFHWLNRSKSACLIWSFLCGTSGSITMYLLYSVRAPWLLLEDDRCKVHKCNDSTYLSEVTQDIKCDKQKVYPRGDRELHIGWCPEDADDFREYSIHG